MMCSGGLLEEILVRLHVSDYWRDATGSFLLWIEICG